MRYPRMMVLAVVAALTALALPSAALASAILASATSGQQVFRVDQDATCGDRRVQVAARPGGGFVAVWLAREEPDIPPHVHARLYRADGMPEGDAFRVDPEAQDGAASVAVAVRPDGEFLVAWLRDPPAPDVSIAVRGRLFGPGGAALGDTFDIQVNGWLTQLDAVVTPSGDYQVMGTGLIVGDIQGGVTALYRLSPEGEILEGDLSARADWGTTLADPDLAVGTGRVVGGISSDSPLSILVAGVEGEAFTAPQFRVEMARQPALAVLPGGNLVTIYTVITVPTFAQFDPVSLELEIRDPAGERLGQVRVDEGGWVDLSGAAVATDPSGRIAVTWAEELADGSSRIMARGFLPDGSPAGPPRELATGGSGERLLWAPRIAWTAGQWTVLWQTGAPLPPVACGEEGLFGVEVLVPQLFHQPALSLRDGRFEARVAWRDPYNDRSGVGHPLPLTDDTGTFWFFREGNRELMVKVIDGRALNDAFWVFYGSTTSVEFDLVVTDTATGDEAVYRNPPFHLASRGDTNAFPQTVPAGGEAAVAAADGAWSLFAPAPSVPAALAAPSSAPSPAPFPAPVRFGQSLPALSILPLERVAGPLSPAIPSFDCDDPAEPGLCLGTGYEVTVRWFDPFNGGSGVGHGVPLSDDSGYFWFFRPDVGELLVKMVPGESVNGYDWVFYGSLTNVAFEMRVYHWSSGYERLYRNPPREFRSVGDTLAFPPGAVCPTPCPDNVQPVCGNDGLTYDNACVAQCFGRTVRHAGACTWEPPQ